MAREGSSNPLSWNNEDQKAHCLELWTLSIADKPNTITTIFTVNYKTALLLERMASGIWKCRKVWNFDNSIKDFQGQTSAKHKHLMMIDTINSLGNGHKSSHSGFVFIFHWTVCKQWELCWHPLTLKTLMNYDTLETSRTWSLNIIQAELKDNRNIEWHIPHNDNSKQSPSPLISYE